MYELRTQMMTKFEVDHVVLKSSTMGEITIENCRWNVQNILLVQASLQELWLLFFPPEVFARPTELISI